MIFQLDPDKFETKTTEIPSYDKGDIRYWTDAEVNSFNEGHSVTWGDPLVSAMLNIANLIPHEYLKDETIGEQLTRIKGGAYGKSSTISSQSGVVFTSHPYDERSRTTVVDVEVPEFGTYKVTMKSGTDSRIQHVMKIIFQSIPVAESEK